MSSIKATNIKPSVVDRLGAIVGAKHVIIDETHRKLMSTDLSYTPGEIAEIVIAPANSHELGACVAVAYLICFYTLFIMTLVNA